MTWKTKGLFTVIPAKAGIQGTATSKGMEKRFYVYILASRRNGTLYVGMTSNLARRIDEHKSGAVPGFTSEYGIKTLVYYEVYDDAENAIRREKRLKRWNRDWKLKLIEKDNPNWRDLTELLNC